MFYIFITYIFIILLLCINKILILFIHRIAIYHLSIFSCEYFLVSILDCVRRREEKDLCEVLTILFLLIFFEIRIRSSYARAHKNDDSGGVTGQ